MKQKNHEKKLQARMADWSRMANAPKIGDGHRDITAYKRPGSNKK